MSDVFPGAKDLLYYFLDAPEVMSGENLEGILREAKIDEADREKVVDFLLYYGILGTRLGETDDFIYSVNYDLKVLKICASRHADAADYVVNPAFWPSLESSQSVKPFQSSDGGVSAPVHRFDHNRKAHAVNFENRTNRGVQSFREKWTFRRIMSVPPRVKVRSSNVKIAATIGLNCHRTHAENTRLRPSWRRGRDSNLRYGRQDFGPSSDYLRRNDWLSSLIGALLCRLGCGRGAP